MRSRRVAQLVRHTLLILLIVMSLAPLLPVSAQEGEAAPGAPTIVTMQGSKFAPQVVMIEVNGTVSWVNQDSFDHDVTQIGDEAGFNSTGGPGGMGNGATYQHKFTEPGIYDYYCTVHPGKPDGMWGRVIVVDEMLALAGAGGEENPEHIGVRWLAHWVGIISFLAVFAVLLIYYFVLKYGETVHATDHRDRKEK